MVRCPFKILMYIIHHYHMLYYSDQNIMIKHSFQVYFLHYHTILQLEICLVFCDTFECIHLSILTKVNGFLNI